MYDIITHVGKIHFHCWSRWCRWYTF